MNIFEAIRKDHDKQRNLLKALLQTSGDTDDRRRLYAELKHELEVHADAEERHFYVPLIEDDMTQDKARHGIAEHHEIDELIEKLDKTEFSSTGWLTVAKSLSEQVIHHLDEEEHIYFQMAGKVLSEDQKLSLAADYQKAMKTNR